MSEHARSTPDQSRQDTGLVLIIDDEEMIRLGLTILLEEWGWEAVAASDADEATEWIASSHRCPDVILADYRLSDGKVGTDAIRQVRYSCGRETPAIIITGDTSADRLAEISGSGFGFAHKPVGAEQLRKLVRSARA